MARAYGSSASLLLKRETVYGQKPSGNFYKMPFTSSNLGSEQGLIDDPVLGFGRDPAQPLRDVINVDGDISVPVDPRYQGFWLTGLFGEPETETVKAEGFITFAANPTNGDTITIIVNGTPTLKEWKDPDKTFTKGHFALQGHDPGSIMTFFEYPGAAAGRAGDGMIHRVV